MSRPNDGFPTSYGNERATIYPHAGPSSYTVVTVGSLATGGDSTSGAEAGIKVFDKVDGGLTDSGRFLVVGVPKVASGGSTTNGRASSTYGLKWISQVTATVGGQAQTAGSEAVATTDLSGETVRLSAYGPK